MARSEAERDEVERPFIQQLEAMGWTHVRGADLAEEREYTDVLLKGRLATAMRRLNRAPETDVPWLDDGHVAGAIAARENISVGPYGRDLRAANFAATELLLHGTSMRGHPVHHHGNDAFVHYVDWDVENEDRVLDRNDFLVVSQLRVRTAAGYEEIPDLVLFVNGIPVAVVECKSPERQDPVGLAIRDLRAYTGNPIDYDEQERDPGEMPRGIPGLFKTVQLLIAAAGGTAQLGTITSGLDHFAPWRSVEPEYENPNELRDALRRVDVAPKLLEAGQEPSEQQQLIAVVLKPVNLLNILRHYVFGMPVRRKRSDGRKDRRRNGGSGAEVPKIKVVCRHQQYRAVEKIVRRLRTGRTRLAEGVPEDERGGVIWHTQGSGKSLTMTFLARRLHMSRDEALNSFTILVVTDRTQLEDQLSAAVRTGERSVKVANSQNDVESMLADGGRHVIFSMIQKYGISGYLFAGDAAGDDRLLAEEYRAARERAKSGGEAENGTGKEASAEGQEANDRPRFTLCNGSDKVLVLVDEAHRSHTSVLHACLRDAVPNAARIGFTGTPIIEGRLRDTERIFGPFIDEYRMAEAERDRVVVPIRYEGRTGPADVRNGETLDAQFENLIADRTPEQKRLLRKRYSTPTERDVAESAPMIRAKAADMLAHYVTNVLPEGFKAQVAVVSRLAAVRYRGALRDARAELLERVAAFEPDRLRGVDPKDFSEEDLLLFWAWQYQEIIRRMEFVPVISSGGEKDGRWRQWTDGRRQKRTIERFLEDLPELPKDNPWAVTHVPEPNPPRMAMHASLPWSRPMADRSTEVPDDSPITFLIVKSMLLTGFDAPVEQVLYLDRPIRDAELLQAIARVNRPVPGKGNGLVVDYYGVLDPLSDALAVYGSRPPAAQAGLGSIGSAVRQTREAAAELDSFLTGRGITDLDTRGGRARATLALRDDEDRAAYDKLLRTFTDSLEQVLPHEDALGFIGDATRWARLQQRVRRHYRDAPGGVFSLRGYGRKVRTLIAEHLEAPEITQVIPPVSILSPGFDDDVREIEDPVEAAAEMEHALRYHLEERVRRQDEEKYRRLSQALKDVLANMDARWRREKLGGLIEQARQEQEEDPLLAGASPMERRVHSWLKDGLDVSGAFEPPEPEELRRLSAGVYEAVRREVLRVSYRGASRDATRLTSSVVERLRSDGLTSMTGEVEDVRAVARRLVGYVQEHLHGFRSER